MNNSTIDVHYLKQREALNTALPIGVRQVETMRTMLTQSLAVLMPFNGLSYLCQKHKRVTFSFL